MNAGAAACVTANVEAADLIRDVRRAAAGGRLLDVHVRSESGRVADAGCHDRLYLLSLREREVLGLIRDGLSNGMIARRLSIDPGTVKTHASAIYRKLAVGSRVELLVRLGAGLSTHVSALARDEAGDTAV